ncbi:MAG: hypothetical protein ACK4IK_09595 [Bacteroidia bacterium]
MDVFKLKQKFEKESNNSLTNDEFQILVLIYPVFLVANADGVFDEQEKDFVKEILFNFLNPIYKNELTNEQYDILIDNYISDLEFLKINKTSFHDEFLSILKNYDIEIKNSISGLLDDVANASGGLSDVEKKIIINLKTHYLS